MLTVGALIAAIIGLVEPSLVLPASLRPSRLKALMAYVFLALAMSVIVRTKQTTSSVLARPDSSTLARPDTSTLARPDTFTEPAEWQYRTFQDLMGDNRQPPEARISSVNAVDFDVPYNGSQHAELTVSRQHVKQITGKKPYPIVALDLAALSVRGQFLCGSDGCRVEARFDDGPVEPFFGMQHQQLGPGNLELEDDFTDKLKTARRVRIRATFFQEGTRTFEFRYRKYPF